MKDIILNIIAEVSARLLLKGFKSYSNVYWSDLSNKLLFIVDEKVYNSKEFLDFYSFISYLECEKYEKHNLEIFFISNSDIDYELLKQDGFIQIP